MAILLSTEIKQKQVNQRATCVQYSKKISEYKAPEQHSTINAACFQGTCAKGSVTQGSTERGNTTSASIVIMALNAS